MKNLWKIIIVLLLVSAVSAVIILKKAENNSKLLQTIASEPNDSLVMTIEAVDAQKLPRLVDLGADKCIPCKMMKPILDELTKEYAGKLQVEFYDVWKDPAPGQKYGVRMIPTQIFLDPNGKELFRHEGFFSKEDILATWKKFGFDFSKDK
jgi:thioredoxin 1